MPLNINTNAAASSAATIYQTTLLYKRATRLSSGSRITQPADDAGDWSSPRN